MELMRRRSLPHLNGLECPEVPRGFLSEAGLTIKIQQTQLSISHSQIEAENQKSRIGKDSQITIQPKSSKLPTLQLEPPLATKTRPESPKTFQKHTLPPALPEQSVSAIQVEQYSGVISTDTSLPVEQEGSIETAKKTLLQQETPSDQSTSSSVQQQRQSVPSVEGISQGTAEATDHSRLSVGSREDPELAVPTHQSPVPLGVHSPREKRRFFKRGFLFGKPQWPNTHLSLGTNCSQLGSYHCWEAIGPAKEVFDVLKLPIKRLLDARVEELEANDPVAGHILVYGMYMIGKEEATARPTILFSCQSARMRRRAIQYMKESRVLKDHPTVKMAESVAPPTVAGRGRLTLLSVNGSGDLLLSNIVNSLIKRDPTTRTTPSNGGSSHAWIAGPIIGSVLGIATVILVIYFTRRKQRKKEWKLGVADGPKKVKDEESASDLVKMKRTIHSEAVPSTHRDILTGIYGIPLIEESSEQRSTIGGVVYLQGKYYGLTVCHAQLGSSQKHPAQTSKPITDPVYEGSEFAFDSEEEASEETILSDVAVTSRGSISSVTTSSRTTTTTTHTSSIEIDNESSNTGSLLRREKQNQDLESRPKNSSCDGPFASSFSGDDLGLDWALVDIPPWISGHDYTQKPSLQPRRIVLSFENVRVIRVLKHREVISGTLSPNSIMVKLARNSKFQEVWSLRVDSICNNLVPGDSGLWVVDALTGDLCGHIVAGIPEAGIAYIVPAYRIFQDIEERMGAPVELVSQFSNAEALPAFELQAIEPVGTELLTPSDKQGEEWPLPLPISPLSLLFAMTEIRDERTRTEEGPKHETFYDP